MKVRIVGSQLPGSRWDGYDDVRVGVQCGKVTVDDVPGDARSATFEFTVAVERGDAGWDFRGPYVHGRPGGRFLYLVWTHAAGTGPEMFRRAKLLLAPVTELAVDPGGTLVGTLGLSDAAGGPVCASVTPPAIRWSTES